MKDIKNLIRTVIRRCEMKTKCGLPVRFFQPFQAVQLRLPSPCLF